MSRRIAANALGAVAFATLLASGSVPSWIPVGCLGGLLLKALVDRWGWRLPGVAAKLLALLLGVVFLWRTLLVETGADLSVTLLAFLAPLLLLQICAARRRFDDFFVILLSLLVVVLGVSTMWGTAPVGLTAAYLAAACHALSVLAKRPVPEASGVRVRLVREPRAWRWAGHLVAYQLAVGGLLVGFLLYLLVPRLSAGPGVADERAAAELASRRQRRDGAERGTRVVTGFPKEIRIGDVGRIKRDSRVAFLASIGLRGRPHDPEPEDRSILLLRARAWGVYDAGEGVWRRGAGAERPVDGSGRIESGPTPLDWTMSVRGYDGLTLFLPQRARVIRAGGRRLVRDDMGVVTSAEPLRQYAVAAALPVTRIDELRGLVPDASRGRLLQVPLDLFGAVERPKDLAEAVDAVRRFFRRGGFRYTLQLPELPEGTDPLRAFLDRREGHCELFASAACLLLRSMGVPARLAGGVRLSERTAPGVYQARFSNAHAWVEIACRRVGFVAVDFTPPDSEAVDADVVSAEAAGGAVAEAERGPGAPGPLLDWRHPFRYGYIEQRRLAHWAGGALDSTSLLPLLVVLALLPLLALPFALRRRRRRDPLRVAGAPGVPRRSLAFYVRWLRDCAARGFRRTRTQTPREFLRSLPPDLFAEGARITAEFERRRYGAIP